MPVVDSLHSRYENDVVEQRCLQLGIHTTDQFIVAIHPQHPDRTYDELLDIALLLNNWVEIECTNEEEVYIFSHDFNQLNDDQKHFLGIATVMAGIIDNFVNEIGGSFFGDVKNVFTNEYSRSTETMLKKYKDYIVRRVAVYRTPIDKPIQLLVDKLSAGKELEYKDIGYDYLYHLYMVFEMKSPSGESVFFLTEKRPSIVYEQRKDLSSLTAGANYIKLNVSIDPKSYTYGNMISYAKKTMGKKFNEYDARDNNCQDYILALMHGLDLRGADEFVKQPVDDLIKQSPKAFKVARKITDLAGFFNRLTGKGKGKKK